ncbi:MAG TPA: hypothetical protein VLV28_10970 [Gaiellaceae bacterium]|nr:hypothetical protein [Gaiellaceae bacterium]
MGPSRSASGYSSAGALGARTRPFLDRARSELDPATVEALTSDGRALSPEQALELIESAQD